MAAPPAASLTFPADGHLEPGDRFEIDIRAERLLLPETLSANGVAITTLEDEHGRALPVTRADERSLLLPNANGSLPQRYGALWLEYQEPGRFRLIVDPE